MRVLFSSANCLLDPSSGAAISVRTLLELMAARGLTCASLTATVFDQPIDPDPLENLRRTGAVAHREADDLWLSEKDGVSHYVLPTKATARAALGREEEARFIKRAVKFIEDFEPDVLVTYDSGLYERAILKIARKGGVSTVFYLANPTYIDRTLFEPVDLVLTDTTATRNLYSERLGLEPMVVGKFVRKPTVPSVSASRKYVTFINPSPEKGVTLFYRIVELALDLAPNVRFLVVESRNRLSAVESRTGMRFSTFRNLRRVGLQSDMGATYARTRILLVPSLWHESGSRSIVEACSLGIPVVASDRGGTPEVLGQSGILITPPTPLIENHWLIPPQSEAGPWVEAIRRLTSDYQFYRGHQQAVLAQWALNDPEPRITSIIRRIVELRAPK